MDVNPVCISGTQALAFLIEETIADAGHQFQAQPAVILVNHLAGDPDRLSPAKGNRTANDPQPAHGIVRLQAQARTAHVEDRYLLPVNG